MHLVCTFGGYRQLYTQLGLCHFVWLLQDDGSIKWPGIQTDEAGMHCLSFTPLWCIGLDVDVLCLGVTHSRHSNCKLSWNNSLSKQEMADVS